MRCERSCLQAVCALSFIVRRRLRTLLWIKLRACTVSPLALARPHRGVANDVITSPPVAFRPVIQPTTRSLLARLTPHQVAHSTSHAPIWPHRCLPYPPCKARIYFRRTCFSAPPHMIIVSCACASTESSQHEFDEITHAWSIRVLSALAHRSSVVRTPPSSTKRNCGRTLREPALLQRRSVTIQVHASTERR